MSVGGDKYVFKPIRWKIAYSIGTEITSIFAAHRLVTVDCGFFKSIFIDRVKTDKVTESRIIHSTDLFKNTDSIKTENSTILDYYMFVTLHTGRDKERWESSSSNMYRRQNKDNPNRGSKPGTWTKLEHNPKDRNAIASHNMQRQQPTKQDWNTGNICTV